ncbi:MAG: hypothetical protein NZ772_18360 [Cyanobacteria bacterium]|nr:hypothetical protein [Cyanobacteriota bacterium]MDW8203210.1 hypothetical protein [Cyanobacteriota bacterium SKYGB_h_bin112]
MTSFYLSVDLGRFDQCNQRIVILAGDDIQIVIFPTGYFPPGIGDLSYES